ncbi:MAG: MoaD/ThiS family protein [Planctomycetales bacterium]
MHVTLEYAAQIKRAAGVASETFDLPEGGTVHDLLRRAAEAHGDGLRRLLFDAEGRMHPSLLVFVGDVQVRGSDAATLSPGDRITVLPPISGG